MYFVRGVGNEADKALGVQGKPWILSVQGTHLRTKISAAKLGETHMSSQHENEILAGGDSWVEI